MSIIKKIKIGRKYAYFLKPKTHEIVLKPKWLQNENLKMYSII